MLYQSAYPLMYSSYWHQHMDVNIWKEKTNTIALRNLVLQQISITDFEFYLYIAAL